MDHLLLDADELPLTKRISKVLKKHMSQDDIYYAALEGLAKSLKERHAEGKLDVLRHIALIADLSKLGMAVDEMSSDCEVGRSVN